MDLPKSVLRENVRGLYEIMKLRVKCERRSRAFKKTHVHVPLTRVNNAVHHLLTQETYFRNAIQQAVVTYDIWDWLRKIKGIGPVLAGMLIAETNIEECSTVSKMWAWWGLAPDSGGSSHRRHRVSKVLGESLLRKKSKPYYQEYLRYKQKKEQTLGPCMGCDGSGNHGDESCANCAGTGQGPWGKSKNHRHATARRYMVKLFLRDFWRVWRCQESLECPAPYQVKKTS